MSVKITIEVTGPVEEEDRGVVAGAAMLLFALGQGEVVEVAEAAPEDPAFAGMTDPPAPCGKRAVDGRVCVNEVGHVGRHLYRRFAAAPAGLN